MEAEQQITLSEYRQTVQAGELHPHTIALAAIDRPPDQADSEWLDAWTNAQTVLSIYNRHYGTNFPHPTATSND